MKTPMKSGRLVQSKIAKRINSTKEKKTKGSKTRENDWIKSIETKKTQWSKAAQDQKLLARAAIQVLASKLKKQSKSVPRAAYQEFLEAPWFHCMEEGSADAHVSKCNTPLHPKNHLRMINYVLQGPAKITIADREAKKSESPFPQRQTHCKPKVCEVACRRSIHKFPCVWHNSPHSQ